MFITCANDSHFHVIGFKIIQRAQTGILVKLKNFMNGLIEGMQSILNMRNKWAFIGHTLFIWVMYVLMFWVIKFTIPEISYASTAVILAAFVIGSFAISVTNGGIGVYPISIGALFVFFGYSNFFSIMRDTSEAPSSRTIRDSSY